MNKTLESYVFFPYIAWALVIGFALFTYSLVMNLNTEISMISSSVNDIEARIDVLEEKVR